MITLEQALKLTYRDHVHYTGLNGGGRHNICSTVIGPRGGVSVKVVECRVNGNVQTWKTRPTEFRVPIKYGMREYGSITHENKEFWHLASECPDKYMRTTCAACGWQKPNRENIPHGMWPSINGKRCPNVPQEAKPAVKLHYMPEAATLCGHYDGHATNQRLDVTCPECLAAAKANEAAYYAEPCYCLEDDCPKVHAPLATGCDTCGWTTSTRQLHDPACVGTPRELGIRVPEENIA